MLRHCPSTSPAALAQPIAARFPRNILQSLSWPIKVGKLRKGCPFIMPVLERSSVLGMIRFRSKGRGPPHRDTPCLHFLLGKGSLSVHLRGTTNPSSNAEARKGLDHKLCLKEQDTSASVELRRLEPPHSRGNFTHKPVPLGQTRGEPPTGGRDGSVASDAAMSGASQGHGRDTVNRDMH